MRQPDDPPLDAWNRGGPTCRQCDQPRLWRTVDVQNAPDQLDEVTEFYCENCDKIEEHVR